mgnify:CR=1 FL=1
MDKKMSVLVSAVCLLLGVIIGFLAAPVKKGIYCGNYNGNDFSGLPEREDGFGEDEIGL